MGILVLVNLLETVQTSLGILPAPLLLLLETVPTSLGSLLLPLGQLPLRHLDFLILHLQCRVVTANTVSSSVQSSSVTW